MMLKKTALLGGALLFLNGCTHSLHVAHVSDFSPTYNSYAQGELVKAHSEQFAVLGFVYDTNYVEQAFTSLQSKCIGGQIQGITTQYSTSHGFLSWTNKIDLQGICIK